MTITERDTAERPRGARRLPPPPPLPARADVLIAYSAGMDDAGIAHRLGTSPLSVGAVREAEGLIANPAPLTDPPATPSEEMAALYFAGLPDASIAARRGISRQAVSEWRLAQRPPLPANRVGPSGADCLRLYHEGLTDEEIAERTGLPTASVRGWRSRLNLPAVSRLHDEHGVVRGGMPDYMHYYLLGYNDHEIGRFCNRCSTAVQHWRAKRALPPNVAPGHPFADEQHQTADERRTRRRRRLRPELLRGHDERDAGG